MARNLRTIENHQTRSNAYSLFLDVGYMYTRPSERRATRDIAFSSLFFAIPELSANNSRARAHAYEPTGLKKFFDLDNRNAR